MLGIIQDIGLASELATTADKYGTTDPVLSASATRRSRSILTDANVFVDSAGNLLVIWLRTATFTGGVTFERTNAPVGYVQKPGNLTSYYDDSNSLEPSTITEDARGDCLCKTVMNIYEFPKAISGYRVTIMFATIADENSLYTLHHGLMTDSMGDLFGTLSSGDDAPTIFELTDTGYQAARAMPAPVLQNTLSSGLTTLAISVAEADGTASAQFALIVHGRKLVSIYTVPLQGWNHVYDLEGTSSSQHSVYLAFLNSTGSQQGSAGALHSQTANLNGGRIARQ